MTTTDVSVTCVLPKIRIKIVVIASPKKAVCKDLKPISLNPKHQQSRYKISFAGKRVSIALKCNSSTYTAWSPQKYLYKGAMWCKKGFTQPHLQECFKQRCLSKFSVNKKVNRKQSKASMPLNLQSSLGHAEPQELWQEEYTIDFSGDYSCSHDVRCSPGHRISSPAAPNARPNYIHPGHKRVNPQI